MYNHSVILRRSYDAVLGLWRQYSPRGRDIEHKRTETEFMLARMAQSASRRFDGTVLIDGTYDNANYWLRYSLLRTGLGLAHGREVGLLGPYRREQNLRTFERYGISERVDAVKRAQNSAAVRLTYDLLAQTHGPDDVLQWKLPANVHPAIVYDTILKRQRLASLDVHQPNMREFTFDMVATIERVEEILDTIKPDLVVLSHPIGMICGSLGWCALERGIPVILAFGLFGALRFTRFVRPTDLFRYYDRPTREEIDALTPARERALLEAGRSYLAMRFAGKADDLPSVFAFQQSKGQVDRGGICRSFGWDPAKPIVAFYASNWFDWPHQLGMSAFRDFLDWTEATVAIARDTPAVNWLFRPHPSEKWFGGVSLADIMSRLGQSANVAVAGKGWNNTAVMNAVDALVTYHGTAGIECASLGKPVLVPDRGKYEDCGFVKVAQSRQQYIDLLRSEWWHDMDLADCRRRAEIFAGWWFCVPDWQRGFILLDDARQEAAYDVIPGLLRDNPEAVAKELRSIGYWWESSHPYYHTSKMAKADGFQMSNLG